MQRRAADETAQGSELRVDAQLHSEYRYRYYCKHDSSPQYYSNCSFCVAGPICCETSRTEESAVPHSGGRSCSLRRSVRRRFCASQSAPKTCQGACPAVKHGFVSPAISETGRIFPYWTLNGYSGVDEVNTDIKLVLIVFHGFHYNDGNRKACYAMDMVRSRLSEDNQRRVLVIAPQFWTIGDKAPESELTWERGAWFHGEQSTTGSPETISSYLVIDQMLEVFVNSGRFPSLRKIKLIGMSAGGQFVQRYAAFGQAYERLKGGPRIEFVVVSPSILSYFDVRRPGFNVSSLCEAGGYCHVDTVLSLRFNFSVPSSSQCGTSYQNWPHGVNGALPPYFNGVDIDAGIRQFRTKQVTYLVGSLDTCNRHASSLPCQPRCQPRSIPCTGSCKANQQGLCRHMRLHAGVQYLDLFYKGNHGHTIHDVPVGHDAYDLYKSEIARSRIIGTDANFP